MGIIGHFIPGPLNNFNPFLFGIIRVFSDKSEQIVLQKYQIGHVFKQLGVGIALNIFLRHGISHPTDHLLAVARLEQQFSRGVGLNLVQVLAPFQIADTVQRVGIAGRFPTLNML